MLQILGDKLKGVVTWAIVLLIAIVFVFLGLNDYFAFSDQSVVAKVNGQKITRKAVDALYERFAAQQGLGGNAEAIKQQVLGTLVRRTALLSKTEDLGFATSDEQLVKMLLKMPVFQVEGQFSKEQYQKVLSQEAYTDASFRKELAQDARLGQFEQGLLQTSFSTPAAVENIVSIAEQKRDIGYLQLPAHYYRKTVSVGEQEIADFYEKNKQTFINPEQVSLEYVQLALDDLLKKVSVSSEEVSQYYQDHQSDYTLPERVHARHLLISVPKDADVAVATKAKERAEDLIKRLKKGEDFSTLAKRWSEDPGSAKKGGDLGWFSRGQMVPAFEEVAFSLKAGAYSDIIRTDFGYHIIQLIAHKDPEVRSLALVEPAIKEQLTFQKGQEDFEKAKVSLETFVLEQNDSLELPTLAKELGLAVHQTELASAEGAKGLLADPLLAKVVFSEDFLKQGFSTHPILLSDQSVVVARLKKHQPASQQTLLEASKAIKQQVIDSKVQAHIQAFSDDFMKEVNAGKNPDILAKAQGFAWHIKKNVSRHQSVNDEIIASAFQLSPPESHQKSKIGKFILSDGSYVLLALYKVVPGVWSTKAKEYYSRALTDISGQMDYMTTIADILESSDIHWSKGSALK